ncbi:MAG: family finger-like protein [Deltaproteobacteria bacterium]|nr:family finger-like protein [Deltaproteobacteria bacterium]
MDVRCEKCQTEYELDEARLKPGGVTVKCTNCGHMFKIRKRSNTNIGAPAVIEQRPPTQSAKIPSVLKRPERTGPTLPPANVAGASDAPTLDGSTPVERQWLIRLETGEQKSCRELVTLQQWIVAAVVSREALISRTGKTWKRLGDITELAQYFEIADEAKITRDQRIPTASKPSGSPAKAKEMAGTMLGIGAPSAAGATILPDDDEGPRTPGFSAPRRPPTSPPPVPGKPVSTKTPPMGSNSTTQPASEVAAKTLPPRSAVTTPPPPPPKRSGSQSGPLPQPPAPSTNDGPTGRGASVAPPAGNRSTAAWVTDASDQLAASGARPTGPAGPSVGKLSAIPDEPAFAGRVRGGPSDASAFDTDRVRALDEDDDDMLPARRGSSAGIWILLMVLLVGGGVAAVVYFVVIKDRGTTAAKPVAADAAQLALAPDGAPIITPVIDAPDAPALTPVELARGELAADQEPRLKTALDSLAGQDGPAALAVRANLGAAIAQALLDRAALVDQSEADKLRKESKTVAIEAATAAQRALKAAADDPGANIAMACVLRLQGRPARDIKRYLEAAKAKPSAEWARDLALAEALVSVREGKLDDAKAAFAAIDQGEGKLETSGDVRARFHLALIALAQNRVTDAKPLVDQVLAAQPAHAAARALAAKLDTAVVKTDPLPPEDNAGKGSGSASKPPPDVPTHDDYDSLLKKADGIADSNCAKASELYLKALEQKPNGVGALTGLGYCHIDAKQFASAHSRFRTALATVPRYEPALAGIAEAYQQQGRKDDAIAAWRTYLEAYPNSAKGLKGLERLGASDGGGTGTQPAGSGATPTPTPTPAPTEPVGSGSG